MAEHRPPNELPSDSLLDGHRIVLGVSGGIAAYKAVELLRLLTRSGADVEVVLTPEACRFVAPLTFTALSGRPARSELWDSDDPIPHTRLGQWADLVILAPSTAHLVARVANGLADDLLTNTLLATDAPVLAALAMHTEMWEQPAVQRNIDTLRSDGVVCLDPEFGALAGGDVGPGRMAEPEDIFAAALDVLEAATTQDLAGKQVLVTAGGTREPVDPVRYLGNRSTGIMGHSIADEAARRGADVVLVTTATRTVAAHVKVENVETAEEMRAAVLAHADAADAIVMSAAVADFRPSMPPPDKIKKGDGVPEIVLEPTPDILAELGRRDRGEQFLVGFAAETCDVAAAGQAKLDSKNLDLLVANLVDVPDSGFGS